MRLSPACFCALPAGFRAYALRFLWSDRGVVVWKYAVMQLMMRSFGQHNKVTKAVVQFVSVDVVDMLCRIKHSTEMALHHKSMLGYVSILIGFWMRIVTYVSVSILDACSAAPFVAKCSAFRLMPWAMAKMFSCQRAAFHLRALSDRCRVAASAHAQPGCVRRRNLHSSRFTQSLSGWRARPMAMFVTSALRCRCSTPTCARLLNGHVLSIAHYSKAA